MKRLEIKPASIEQILDFMGEYPKRSVKAWIGTIDNNVVGIAGFTYGDACMTVFSNLKKEIKHYKKQLWRAAKMIIAEAKQFHSKIMAIADPEEPTASIFLKKLGFSYLGQFPEGEVYQWHK